MVAIKPVTVRGHAFPSQKHAIMWLYRIGLKRRYIADEVGCAVNYVTAVLSRTKTRTGREKSGDGNSGHVAERGVWVNGTKYASVHAAIIILARAGYAVKKIAEYTGRSEGHVHSELSRERRKKDGQPTQPKSGAHWDIAFGSKSDFIGCQGMRHKTCQWLNLDDPSTEDAMCGEPVVPGKPYCAHHQEASVATGPQSTFMPGLGKLRL